MSSQHVLAIESYLASNYPSLTSPSISLLRSYTNDVYLVQSGDQRCVLKIYGFNWRSDSEILFEIDLINHLITKGINVAGTVATSDGEVLKHLEIDGKKLQAVLFHFAEGEKPSPPFSLEMYKQEGTATAALHLAADGFATQYQRRPLDLNFLIDQPVNLVQSMPVTDEIKHYLAQFGHELKRSIEDFSAKGLDWGICHGDLTFDNFHLTDDGQTVWYDFDSGGFGWRAIDIQGWVATNPEMIERQDAFISGYRTVRDISQNDVDASPYIYAAQEIWGIQVELERRIITQGDVAIQAYLNDAIEKLKVWHKHFNFNIG